MRGNNKIQNMTNKGSDNNFSGVASSFWMPKWGVSDKTASSFSSGERRSHELYVMASRKRAIGNFVRIVTNKTIPVVFNNGKESFTNGKRVVIGSEIVKPKDFDVTVGLALHEASHIKLSDFEFLKEIGDLIPSKIYDLAETRGVGRNNVIRNIKSYTNWVEDRRIDTFIYNSAPGYREYYKSMYNKYFNDKIITKALQSSQKTSESLDSYSFRIINIHNPKSDLKALKGLKEIYNIIDLNNIDRLKNSTDSFNVAVDIFEVILNNLPIPEPEDDTSDNDGSEQSDIEDFLDDFMDENGSGSDESEDTDNDEDGSGSDGSSDGDEEDTEDGSGSGSGGSSDGDEEDTEDGSSSGSDGSSDVDGDENGDDESGNDSISGSGYDGEETDSEDDEFEPTEELTQKQKKSLENKIKNQEDFINGDVSRKKIDARDNKSIEQIEQSGSEMKSVAEDVDNWRTGTSGVKVVVVKKVTKDLLDSNICPLSHSSGGEAISQFEDEVARGIKIGTVLGKKLQVRAESRNTIYNRQKIGKIDKRMIASLGYGNENVFQFNEVDNFNKANLHISIDASGSMMGEKWRETLTNVTAMCKAVDMIPNLEIQITMRTTDNSSPYVAKVYDSREDKFIKVKQLFPYLDCLGTTPEGLCFEAIMDDFLASTNNIDSYFINISDGSPYYSNSEIYYSGRTANEHTRKMVKKIENMGVKILSYYVEEGQIDDVSHEFRTMYGSASRAISITNINQITRTVNKMFLEK